MKRRLVRRIRSFAAKSVGVMARPKRIAISATACAALLGLALSTPVFAGPPAEPAAPIKVGFSIPLSGREASAGKEILAALQLWRSDVNARGGLLGRPLELVYDDDQNDPRKVRAIYRKLLSVEKVDLVLGPYGTYAAGAALRTLLEFGRPTISLLAIGANRIFSYSRYFAMSPSGRDGAKAFAVGFFDLARTQKPMPQTAAILTAAIDLAARAAQAARVEAGAAGLRVIFDKTYPIATADFEPLLRDLKGANASGGNRRSGARGRCRRFEAEAVWRGDDGSRGN